MRLYKNAIFIIGLLFCAVFAYSFETQDQLELPLEVQFSHNEIARGETFWVHIKGERRSKPRDYQIHFTDQTVNFVPHPNGGKREYLALVGVPIEQEPGTAELVISTARCPIASYKNDIIITAGSYGKENISVPKEFTDLPRKIRDRIEQEWLLVTAFYKSLEQKDERISKLAVPLDDVITSDFGTQRMFNDTVQSYHNGIDLRAAEGTEIKAAQAGHVVFTSDLYYAGNHVVIDHGGGVLTTYSHLSDILVKPGDKVKQGEVIALSGSTGRVSGPHLHWVTKVNKVTVNPIQLKELLDELS
jgi:hypothetical protein